MKDTQKIAIPSEQDEEAKKQCSKCTRTLSLKCFSKGRICKECISKYRKQYHADHKKEANQQSIQYYYNNKGVLSEKNRQYSEQYYADNKETVLAKQRKRYSDNRTAVLAKRKKCIADNKQYYISYWRRYQSNNKESVALQQQKYHRTEKGRLASRSRDAKRRMHKMNTVGSYTAKELQEQLVRQNHKCYYCHKKLGDERRSWHADHIVPLSRGGTNFIDNIVLACSTCNLSKKDKLLHEWTKGGRLL